MNYSTAGFTLMLNISHILTNSVPSEPKIFTLATSEINIDVIV